MDTPQPPSPPSAPSPRQRLQELLAIPERQRTDAEWDELNLLEIELASANRQDAPQQGRPPGAPGSPGQPRPGGRPQGKKPFAKFHKKRSGGNPP
jgi:hypothetical protein